MTNQQSPESTARGTTPVQATLDGTAVGGPVPAGATKSALVFIIATVVLDMLSIGLIVPIMPRLVEGFFPGKTTDRSEERRVGKEC